MFEIRKNKKKILSSLLLNATDNLNINEKTLFETDDIRKNYIFFQTYGVNLLAKITCVYDNKELVKNQIGGEEEIKKIYEKLKDNPKEIINIKSNEIINTNIIPSNLINKLNILYEDYSKIEYKYLLKRLQKIRNIPIKPTYNKIQKINPPPPGISRQKQKQEFQKEIQE